MRKMSLREIKGYILTGMAKDVTNEKYIPDCYSKEAYSTGIYGINGGLYKDKAGNMYAITARNSNLFRIF